MKIYTAKDISEAGVHQQASYTAELGDMEVELTAHYFLGEPDYIDWDRSYYTIAGNKVIQEYTDENVQEIYDKIEQQVKANKR